MGTYIASFKTTVGSSAIDYAVVSGIPANALLNEDGSPILNEDGSYILTTD